MHPIEHLRYVARAAGADASMLTREAAGALSVFADDPHALLAGAKSLLARQPSVGPVWWMCSHLIASSEPRRALRHVVDALDDDPTPRLVDEAIGPGATVAISGWPDSVMRALVGRPDVRVLALDVEGQGHGVVRRLDRSGIDAEAVDPVHIAGVVAEADVALVETGAMGVEAGLTDVGGFALAAVARAASTRCWLVAAVGRRLPEPYWQEIAVRTIDPDGPAFVAPYEVVTLAQFDRSIGPETDCPLVPELLRPVR